MKRHHIAASVLTALVVFTAVGFLVFGGTNDKSGAASRDKHGHAPNRERGNLLRREL